MGRKRKVVAVNGTAMAAQVKSSDALPISNGSKAIQKKPRIVNELPRRSGRVRSLVLPGRTREVMKHTVERVNLTEKEKGKEATETEKFDDLPAVNENEVGVETQAEQVNHRSDVKELSLDEKVNYLVRMVDEFKPKVFGQNNESYKSLYIQTQKKYEALAEEHYEVVRKLEFALGKIAAYEKMQDAVGPPREVIFVSDLGKLTGGADVHQAQDAAGVAEADKNPKKKKTNNKKKKGC
ncbi:hypothetical protein CASFOL_005243 [Castilleja foliolosa]|uniref:Uncharacterized protein n=1 Tax=Castilleja foliolosa TaxID=1961234 RepID=A0ABD3E2V7_9LAMI